MSGDKETSIQEMVTTNEAIEDAKQEVIQEIADAEAKNEAGFWIKVRNFFCRAVKKVVQIVCTMLKAEILFILNNEENQALAKVAVLTAWKLGLKSNAAWAAAWAVIQAGEIVIGKGIKVKATEVRTSIKETLLQLIYCCLSNQNESSVLACQTK